MWLSRLAINRPILIWMVLIAIAIMGVKAYLRLPAELNPKVDLPTIAIATIYPGAGPPEIETQVTKPLEDAVGTVAGVKDVYSTSQENVSFINVDFLVGTDLSSAIADVRARVDAVRAMLPPGVGAPIINKVDINALPILYLGYTSTSLNLQQLRDLMDNVVAPRLERVPGVATVEVVGGEQKEIEVAVDAPTLGNYGLTIEDVVNSVKASGIDVPGGGITTGMKETDVRLAGAYTSLDALRQTQILAPQLQRAMGYSAAARRGDQLPAPALAVADVANVYTGQATRTQINRVNGREGVSLIFAKSSDANTVAVVNQIYQALEQLKPSLPNDLTRAVLRDDLVTVGQALDDVDTSLVLGAFLAMCVILLFLHNLRGTFIVFLAIPSCVVGTFLVMWLAHFTLNQMTLVALSLSTGILVDDSIVVLESITRHLRNGETPREAAFNGRTEIGFADITTTTLVDVVVFAPIAFMGGIVGGFFKEFGLTIVTATLLSLVVSFTVTPMLASRWYKSSRDVDPNRGPFAPFERLYKHVENVYRWVLRWSLGHRPHVILIGFVSLGLIFVLSYFKLGFDFIPEADLGEIAVSIEMPPGSSLEATDLAAKRIEEIAQKRLPDVAAVVTTVGEVTAGFGRIPQRGPEFGQVAVRLTQKSGLLDRVLHPAGFSGAPRSHGDVELADMLRSMVEPVARELGGKIAVTANRSAAGIAAPVQIEVNGKDIDRLTAFAEQVKQILVQTPGVVYPDVTVRTGKPEVRVNVDRQRAAQFGVPVSLAGAAVRDSVTGNTDSVFKVGADEYPIRIRLRNVQRDSPSEVGNIVVGADSQGMPVTLADISDISMRTGPTTINRHNGARRVNVNANLAANVPLGNMQPVIQAKMDAIPHEGIGIKWGGDAELMSENALYFASALILAVVLVYIVMASLFNNLGTPFVIMFALPMALVGALGALVITHTTLTLVASIGIIMLVGLMGRNAILLLDYTNTLRARGEERSTAIEEAGATRLRPILMTTTATIAGMLPVAMRIGQAAEMRAPMAIVVIGGLLISSALTLVVIPVLYSLFDDWFGKRKRPTVNPPTGPGLELHDEVTLPRGPEPDGRITERQPIARRWTRGA